VGQHGIDPAGPPRDPTELPPKPQVGIDIFFALDLRAGRVTEVEPFPEARKPSYKLAVEFGAGVGILRTSAQVTSYEPQDLLGRMVVGAINLGAKRIAGFRSEFLILGAPDPKGTVRLLQLEPEVEPGAPIA
jgi:tRNA-binding protein